jgi:hypothetical protein
MASIANITVKKNDGTTDILWTGIQASAGDKSPAIWRSLTVGSAPAFQPVMKMTSRDNGTKSARRVDVEITYPYTTVGSDGKTYLAEKAIYTGSFLCPQGMPVADFNEAVSQAMNLTAATLVKDSFKAGFAPT